MTRPRTSSPPEERPGAPGRHAPSNKSLRRALAILEAFTEATPGWTVSDLARHLGVSKSSVSTMLSTLAEFALVRKAAGSERYELGLRCLEMGYLAASRLALRDLAFPFLGKLLSESGHIVYLGIPHRGEVLYLEALYPEHRRINFSSQGKRAPLYCTGIGKALLAWLPEPQRAAYLERAPYARHTPATLTGSDELRRELERTRRRGYAVDRQEREPGIQCVAAAVRNRSGEAVAAVSLSGPAEELAEATLDRYGQLVAATARDVARKLQIAGYRGSEGR